ncbi:hypothetical protein VM1G_10741 [Cytospora mali]|uniref:Uncharacterized protein n=1 Tax=Cytospora mali TaxID=578113 RepID=A0A194VIJ5_CYTMA|nr:hypothetical protein VM1G_10741 [Valsa mali]
MKITTASQEPNQTPANQNAHTPFALWTTCVPSLISRPSIMTTKRDIDVVTGADHDEPLLQPSTKRARNSGNQKKTKQSQEPQTDLTYGQRSCFPSLNHSVANSDEDLEFEDESDALAYLQSVRQQASGIPHLLVAPKSGPHLPPPRPAHGLTYDDNDDGTTEEEAIDRSIYDDGRGDPRGYYEDGAYTALPDNFASNHNHPYDTNPGTANDEDDNSTTEAAKIPQAYYASISNHFTTLRRNLHRTPPPAALAALTREQSPHVGRFGPGSKTFTIWSVRVRHADPAPAQVAAMDKDAVFRLLRVVLGGKFLRRGAELRERTSRWLWALLARLPDRGELDHMEVGYVRELGKRAALLMHSLREMAALRREVEGGGGGADGDDDDDDDGGGGGGLEGEEEDWDVEGEIVDDEGDNSTPAEKEDEATPVQASSDLAISSSTAPTSLPEAKDEVDGQMEDGEVDDKTAADRREEEPAFNPVRARMNMRATLNMILTVAGEFYGQRDLLEFREPFEGL